MINILIAALWLASGLSVYWFFGPDIAFFKWLGFHAQHPSMGPGLVQVFFRNHFADLAWCASAFSIANFLRERDCPSFYPSFLVALPFLSELSQAVHLTPGTFDWLDLLIYALLFLLFFQKEVLRMRPTHQHVLGGALITVFLAALIGSGGPVYKYQTGVFKLPPQEKDEVWTKPSLARIMQASKTRSIVLRVPNPSKEVTGEEAKQVQKSNENANVFYSTVEKELAKAGFTVRDRGLFSKVLEHENLDYTKIGFLTETDLILEVVRFSEVGYWVEEYQDEAGATRKAQKPMWLTGAIIEFKLISVKENDLIGSFIFHYKPCTEGCSRRFVPEWNKSADIPLNEEVFNNLALRLVSKLGQY